MDGYKEAAKIDRLINKLLEDHPPAKDNALQWLSFAGTIMTGLGIIRTEAEKVWKGDK